MTLSIDLPDEQTAALTATARAQGLSAEEYARLKRRDRGVHTAGDLPDDWLEAVERSEMDPRHDHLNADLKDWKP